MSDSWADEEFAFAEKPTVSPLDVEWLEASVPLLSLPEKTAVLHLVDVDVDVPVDVSELERWLSFLSTSLVVGRMRPRWGLKYGAVTVVDLHVSGVQLDVVVAHGRLAVLVVGPAPAGRPQPRIVKHQLESAVAAGARYSMEWAAAAYILDMLEGQ